MIAEWLSGHVPNAEVGCACNPLVHKKNSQFTLSLFNYTSNFEDYSEELLDSLPHLYQRLTLDASQDDCIGHVMPTSTAFFKGAVPTGGILYISYILIVNSSLYLWILKLTAKKFVCENVVWY